MSKVAIQGAATGTGVFTLASPATNTNRTLTLPDEAGTVLTDRVIGVNASAPDDSVVVDASGNVGIGTSSPDVPLEVQLAATSDAIKITGTSSYAPYLAFENSEGGTPYVRGRIRGASNSTDGGLVFETGSSGSMSERARITGAGDLLVGTTTGTEINVGKLRIVQSSFGTAATFYNVTAGAETITVQNNATSGTRYLFWLAGNSGGVGSITHNGSSTAYNTTSDYRLKEDWVAVADASTRVNALKPVNFAWKATGDRVDGFLAHELAEIVPEAVVGDKDAVELVDIKDEEGNVTGQEERPIYQGIDQSKLVPLLTAALQEALAKIEDLTARVVALEGQP